MLNALLLGTAGAMSGLLLQTVGDARWGAISLVLSGLVFGVVLAGFLWVVVGVHSPATAVVVSVTSAGAFLTSGFAMAIMDLIALPMLGVGVGTQAAVVLRFVVAGTVAGGLVSLGFIVPLLWPRKTTRVVTELLLGAAAGGLLAAAGAILEDPSHSSELPLRAIWQGGMGVVLALMAYERLTDASAETPMVEKAH